MESPYFENIFWNTSDCASEGESPHSPENFRSVYFPVFTVFSIAHQHIAGIIGKMDALFTHYFAPTLAHFLHTTSSHPLTPQFFFDLLPRSPRLPRRLPPRQTHIFATTKIHRHVPHSLSSLFHQFSTFLSLLSTLLHYRFEFLCPQQYPTSSFSQALTLARLPLLPLRPIFTTSPAPKCCFPTQNLTITILYPKRANSKYSTSPKNCRHNYPHTTTI